MSTQVQAFEDFPLTFIEHDTVPYIAHKSLADYFKWPKTTRKNRFNKIAENHPEMVAYFKTTPRGVAQKMGHPLVSTGGRARKLDPSLVGTDEFKHLSLCNQITRCLSKQGLILAMIKEDKHPRAIEFQKFACAVLDSYMTHGEVGPHEATSVADLTAKINAENEAKRLENINFSMQLEMKRLEIQQSKVKNDSLIREKKQLETDKQRLLNLPAFRTILKEKLLLGARLTQNQISKINKFISRNREFITWETDNEGRRRAFFRTQEHLAAARPAISRLRLYMSRQRCTMAWAKSNGKCMFK